eukprot:10904993-Prorocentrum_lima.AAC.1
MEGARAAAAATLLPQWRQAGKPPPTDLETWAKEVPAPARVILRHASAATGGRIGGTERAAISCW